MVIAGRYSIGAQDTALQSRAENSVKYVGRFGGVTAKAFYSFGADGTPGVNGEVPGAQQGWAGVFIQPWL